jgi:hypothetical protein
MSPRNTATGYIPWFTASLGKPEVFTGFLAVVRELTSNLSVIDRLSRRLILQPRIRDKIRHIRGPGLLLAQLFSDFRLKRRGIAWPP